jgi:drug/metabolite transporter (DMT)-like permease
MSAVLFGASTPLAKIAVSSADPIVVAGLLYLGSGIGLAVLRTVRAESLTKRTETPLSRADLPWLAGATLAGGVVGPTLLLLGLLSTQASTASLLLNLEAVATAAIAWLIFRENVDMRVGTGFMLIILGGILLSLPRGDGIAISGGALLLAPPVLGIDNLTKISAVIRQIATWKSYAGLSTLALLSPWARNSPRLTLR